MLSQKTILQRIDRQLAADAVRKPLTWFWLKILTFFKACIGLFFYLVFLPANAPAATAKALTGGSAKSVKVTRSAKPVNRQGDEDLSAAMIRYARTLLGVPYRTAGKSPKGFDCSGFTGYVFRKFGIGLPSSSSTQAAIGQRVSVAAARMGDLAFFGHRTKTGRMVVTHTGIVASDSGQALKVIHSASHEGVTVTNCSAPGYWKKNLLFIKRVLAPEELKVKSEDLNPNESWLSYTR